MDFLYCTSIHSPFEFKITEMVFLHVTLRRTMLGKFNLNDWLKVKILVQLLKLTWALILGIQAASAMVALLVVLDLWQHAFTHSKPH